MAGSGVWAFAQPFSIQVIGLHALTGFIFIAVIGLHIANNFVPLKKYSKNSVLWFLIGAYGELGSPLLFPTKSDQSNSWVEREFGTCPGPLRNE